MIQIGDYGGSLSHIMANKRKTSNKPPDKAPAKAAGKGMGREYGVSIMVPIILVLGFVPLVVQLYVGILPDSISVFWNKPYSSDFFSYYKSIFLYLLAAYMIGAFCYFKSQGMPEQLSIKEPSLRIVWLCLGVFAAMTILSTLFAQYKGVALWGAPERREGMLMLLVYLLLMLYGLWAYSNQQSFQWIIIPLGVVVVIQGFLGIFQFWGHDLFLTDFGSKFIVPSEYRDDGGSLGGLFEEGKIYGTLYHYNYMGSFGAMLAPLFLVLALFLKDKKQQLCCGALTLVTFFILFGSTSRAGIVGIGLAFVCFLLFFWRKLIEHYKITAGCLIIAVIFVFGVNMLTNGVAFERLPSLLKDMTAITAGDKDFDYRDHIPIREIALSEDAATFVYQDQTIVIECDADKQPVFYDAAGNLLEYQLTGKTYDVNGAKFEISDVKRDGQVTDELAMGVYVNGEIQTILYNDGTGFALTNGRLQDIHYVEADAWGFQGQEKIGSARGYIWSRSFPMLKDTILLGNGPDTYFAEFPQGDLLGKLYAYDTMQMIVDKPHNLYLQIALNEGVIALLAFLALMIVYLMDSVRLYAMKRSYSQQQTIGAAISLAIIGYLGAGVFNDSVVSVAPIFWILLGIGFAVNRMEKQKTAEAA